MLPGARLRVHQFKAIFIKRFHNCKRNVKGLFAELVVPVLLVAFALFVMKMVVPTGKRDEPPLPLWAGLYTDVEEPSELFYSLAACHTAKC